MKYFRMFLLGIVMIAFLGVFLLDEVIFTQASVYSITQRGTIYTGRIQQGHSTVKVTDSDGNTIILDAAHGPIDIRRSDLGIHPID